MARNRALSSSHLGPGSDQGPRVHAIPSVPALRLTTGQHLSSLPFKLAGKSGELYNSNNQFQTAKPNQAGYGVTFKLSVKLGDGFPSCPPGYGEPSLPFPSGDQERGADPTECCAPHTGCWSRGRRAQAIWPHRHACDVQTL